jgi:ribosomal protein L27
MSSAAALTSRANSAAVRVGRVVIRQRGRRASLKTHGMGRNQDAEIEPKDVTLEAVR